MEYNSFFKKQELIQIHLKCLLKIKIATENLKNLFFNFEVKSRSGISNQTNQSNQNLNLIHSI